MNTSTKLAAMAALMSLPLMSYAADPAPPPPPANNYQQPAGQPAPAPGPTQSDVDRTTDQVSKNLQEHPHKSGPSTRGVKIVSKEEAEREQHQKMPSGSAGNP